MNHVFYELRAKEKLGEMVDDGLRSQALHRSKTPTRSLLGGRAKHGLLMLAGLGIFVAFLIR
jgi:hypothetical protein